MNFQYWPFGFGRTPDKAFSIGLFICVFLPGAEISAPAFAAGGASMIFNSYSNIFYLSNGTNAYFKDDQAGGVADFWKQAEEIECVIDACEWDVQCELSSDDGESP